MATVLLFLEQPATALLLGLGGGSLVRFLRAHRAGLDITVVERDRAVVSIAREFFEIPEDGPDFRVVEADARSAVTEREPQADLIFADLFDGGGLPGWIREAPVYAACRNHLSPGGALVSNLWVDKDDESLRVMGGIREAFDGRTLVITLEGYRNLIVLAFDAPPAHLDFCTLYERAEDLGARTAIDFPRLLTGMRDANLVDDQGFVL
jgi:spermidine synthase